MRIAHLNNALRQDGTGHTNSTLDLAVAQTEAGHDVVFVCGSSDPATRRFLTRHGVRLVEISSFRSWGAVWRARTLVRQVLREVDVVHLHTVRAFGVAGLADPGAWWRSVATIHNPHQRSAWLMCLSRRIVSLSEANRRQIRRASLGIRNPSVVHNGTRGTSRLPPLGAVTSRPMPANSLVFVGALHRRKGLDLLIRAISKVARQVPDVQLFVIGNRDDDSFEELAADLGLAGRVHFVGFSDDPREWILGASAFVLPSRSEGFGNVLTEARECGVPIVATRVGGIPEALADGQGGLLVEPESVDSLALALVAVLTDDELAERLRAATQIDFDRMMVSRAEQEYAQVYAGIAAS